MLRLPILDSRRICLRIQMPRSYTDISLELGLETRHYLPMCPSRNKDVNIHLSGKRCERIDVSWWNALLAVNHAKPQGALIYR